MSKKPVSAVYTYRCSISETVGKLYILWLPISYSRPIHVPKIMKIGWQ